MGTCSDDPRDWVRNAYISFPSGKDPDFQNRYPGRATIDVITFARAASFDPWVDSGWSKRPAEYDALKRELTERLLRRLTACLPQVRGNITHAELSTPLTTRHFTGHARGEIYGLAHTGGRFRASWLRPATPVRNLFLTGADVLSCGVGGAAMGGALCASAILRRNLFAEVA
jgi:all-trans-retinol 13,14-reductase